MDRFAAGGRMLLLGAGTSGRLAVQEAAEVPGTYGIPAERVQARVAGGGAGQLVGTDAAEDDVARGRADIEELGCRPARRADRGGRQRPHPLHPGRGRAGPRSAVRR